MGGPHQASASRLGQQGGETRAWWGLLARRAWRSRRRRARRQLPPHAVVDGVWRLSGGLVDQKNHRRSSPAPPPPFRDRPQSGSPEAVLRWWRPAPTPVPARPARACNGAGGQHHPRPGCGRGHVAAMAASLGGRRRKQTRRRRRGGEQRFPRGSRRSCATVPSQIGRQQRKRLLGRPLRRRQLSHELNRQAEQLEPADPSTPRSALHRNATYLPAVRQGLSRPVAQRWIAQPGLSRPPTSSGRGPQSGAARLVWAWKRRFGADRCIHRAAAQRKKEGQRRVAAGSNGQGPPGLLKGARSGGSWWKA